MGTDPLDLGPSRSCSTDMNCRLRGNRRVKSKPNELTS